MNRFSYRIFGLTIQSEFEISGLISVLNHKADVDIIFGKTPNHLKDSISSGVLFESTEKEFLLKLPRIGNYLVQYGNLITIDPKPEATNDEIRLFLLGSVFSALLYQKGFTPLHGSAVEVDGKAMIILGNSAAGKSTLTASLVKYDYPLITDDLSAVLLEKSGCVIMPGIPFIKLWDDTKNKLFPNGTFRRVRPQLNKFNIPVNTHHYTSGGIEIHTIMNLQTRNSNTFHAESIQGAQKLAILRENVFRDQFIAGKGMMDHHFRVLSILAKQSRLFNVERPIQPLRIEALRNFVIKNIIES